MTEIDFLPSRYREADAQRKKHVWRLVVVVAYAGLLLGAAYAQKRERRRVEDASKLSMQQHAAVVAQTERLTQFQNQLQRVEAEAELYTYLRHPWPRTQVLSAILASLPNSVLLEDLRLQRSQSADAQPGLLRDRVRAATASGEEADTRPPARRDLDAFREAHDHSKVVLTLSGTTADEAALHVYLGQLSEEPLFSKVELVSIERTEKHNGASRFGARATLRGGYGQPHGPTSSPSLAQSAKPEARP